MMFFQARVPSLTFKVDLTMNLMSGPHYKCETMRRKNNIFRTS